MLEEDEDKRPNGTVTVTYNDRLFHLAGWNADPFRVTVYVNCAVLSMEIDTGALVSVISETIYRSSLWTDRE